MVVSIKGRYVITVIAQKKMLLLIDGCGKSRRLLASRKGAQPITVIAQQKGCCFLLIAMADKAVGSLAWMKGGGHILAVIAQQRKGCAFLSIGMAGKAEGY